MVIIIIIVVVIVIIMPSQQWARVQMKLHANQSTKAEVRQVNRWICVCVYYITYGTASFLCALNDIFLATRYIHSTDEERSGAFKQVQVPLISPFRWSVPENFYLVVSEIFGKTYLM